MKNRIDILLSVMGLIFLFFGCDSLGTKYEVVEYVGISVEVPEKWEVQRYYDKEIHNCHFLILNPLKNGAICTFSVYQNRKLSKTIFESIKKELLEDNPELEGKTKFTGIYKSTFNEAKTHEMSFAGALDGMKYEGKIILFQDSRDTFVIYLFGEKAFMDSERLKHVLSSFKIKNASFML